MKRFKSKKRFNVPKIIIILIIILLIYFLYHHLSHKSVIKTNRKLLYTLTNSYNKYSYNNSKNDTAIITVFKTINKMINKPSKLLINDLKYNEKKSEEVKEIKQVSMKEEDNPLVYIYNTHQKESYNSTYVEDYNITPDVLLMSHIIQEKLNNEGVKTIVEENDITKYLQDNDMNYSKSYQASRVFLMEKINSYPSLKLIIDLHRDAANYDISTTVINGKTCAKVMFVVGKEYNTYEQNLETTNKINNKIIALYPELSRGVLEKKGKGVNGVYNQDLKNNIILLELGSDKNNIDELTNTIELIIPIIKEYVNEKA